MENQVKNKNLLVALIFILCLLGNLVESQEKLNDTIENTQNQIKEWMQERPAAILALFVFWSIVLLITGCLLWLIFKHFFVSLHIPITRPFFPAWGIKEAFFLFILFIIFQLIFALSLQMFSNAAIQGLTFKFVAYILVTLLSGIGVLLVLHSIHRRRNDLVGRHRTKWKELLVDKLGIRSITWKEPVGAIMGYVCFLPWYLCSFFWANVILVYIGYKPPAQQIALDVMNTKGLGFVLAIVTAIVIAPLVEEFVFRAMLYQGIRHSFSAKPAMVLSALLFAVVHQNVLAFLPIFALGIFLAMLYESSHSLWPPVIAHSCHNTITLVYLIFFL